MSEKSRSYAIGSPFPLLLIVSIDHSPEYNSAFTIGQVESSGVSSGCKGVFEQSHSSPSGATRMLDAVSLLQYLYSETNEKSLLESEFWK